MLNFITPDDPLEPADPRLLGDAADLEAAWNLNPNTGEFSPNRERLRHLIIGSPEGVQLAIARLQTLQYAEQLAWSRLLRIPPTGITLTPVQGEVFSYLLRYRQLG